jgi:ABC-type amino acid transport substrate-binding protein
MDISEVFSGASLKAEDLKGREIAVVIASVAMKTFEDGNKLVLAFQGARKTLVANRTNSQMIAELYGPNTDHWVGREVVLFPSRVNFQGRLVDAIRVKGPRAPVAPVKAPPVAAYADDMGGDSVPF